MHVDVSTAIIAAVPATVAATAAWWAAAKTNRRVATTNGHTMGQLAEVNYELLKSVSHRQDEMSKALEVHVLDVGMHCKEQTEYYHTHDGISGDPVVLNQETSKGQG